MLFKNAFNVTIVVKLVMEVLHQIVYHAMDKMFYIINNVLEVALMDHTKMITIFVLFVMKTVELVMVDKKIIVQHVTVKKSYMKMNVLITVEMDNF